MNGLAENSELVDSKKPKFKLSGFIVTILTTLIGAAIIASYGWAWSANGEIKSNKAQGEYTNNKIIDTQNHVATWMDISNKRFDRLEDKIDKMNEKMDKMNEKISKLK